MSRCLDIVCVRFRGVTEQSAKYVIRYGYRVCAVMESSHGSVLPRALPAFELLPILLDPLRPAAPLPLPMLVPWPPTPTYPVPAATLPLPLPRTPFRPTALSPLFLFSSSCSALRTLSSLLRASSNSFRSRSCCRASCSFSISTTSWFAPCQEGLRMRR